MGTWPIFELLNYKNGPNSAFISELRGLSKTVVCKMPGTEPGIYVAICKCRLLPSLHVPSFLLGYAELILKVLVNLV